MAKTKTKRIKASARREIDKIIEKMIIKNYEIAKLMSRFHAVIKEQQ